MAIPAIVIQVAADTTKAVKGINDLNNQLGKGLPAAGKLRAGLDKAFVPAAAALTGLVAVGADFAQMAAEDSKSATLLAVSLKNTTGATDAQVASVEEWITAQGKALGVADDQLRPALQSLAVATGDVGKAQELAALAMDLAASKGIPVEQAASAVAKAYAGQTTALSRLVPGLDQAALKSGDFSKVAAELDAAVGGSAEALANAEGNTSKANVAWAEAQESLGQKLLPVMTKVTEIATALATWVGENTTVALIFAGVIGTLAAAIVVLKGALAAWDLYNKYLTASQTGLNLAFLANPITWIVLAIIALIAAIVYLWNTNEGFREALTNAWESIKNAAVAVWDGIINAVKSATEFLANLFLNYTPIGYLIKNFEKIKTGVVAIWNNVVKFFKGAITKLGEFFTGYFNFFKNIGGAIVDGIKNGISGAWDALQNFIGDKVSGIVDGVKGLLGISSPSRVFKTIGQQMVDGLEIGLRGMSKVSDEVNSALTFDPNNVISTTFDGSLSAGAGAGVNVTINVQGQLVDPEGAARAIEGVLRRSNLRAGAFA